MINFNPSDIAVSSLDEKFLQRALKLVEQNLSNTDFNVDRFSKEMGVSRVQLHRKIIALTNQSSSSFIRAIRLKRAAQMLRKHSGNISEIAYEVGFNNPSYFSECFHKYFGLLPSDYINQHV